MTPYAIDDRTRQSAAPVDDGPLKTVGRQAEVQEINDFLAIQHRPLDIEDIGLRHHAVDEVRDAGWFRGDDLYIQPRNRVPGSARPRAVAYSDLLARGSRRRTLMPCRRWISVLLAWKDSKSPVCKSRVKARTSRVASRPVKSRSITAATERAASQASRSSRSCSAVVNCHRRTPERHRQDQRQRIDREVAANGPRASAGRREEGSGQHNEQSWMRTDGAESKLSCRLWAIDSAMEPESVGCRAQSRLFCVREPFLRGERAPRASPAPIRPSAGSRRSGPPSGRAGRPGTREGPGRRRTAQAPARERIPAARPAPG